VSVMVGEMHTDVVQESGAKPKSTSETGPEPLGVADEKWRAAHRRAEYLARRVRAENFDD
jgi:hypothetical protein